MRTNKIKVRDILFRGKCCKGYKNGEWITGWLVDEKIARKVKKLDKFVFHLFDVESGSVGQLTPHKDKHGKKVFEGDIIRYTGKVGKSKGKVLTVVIHSKKGFIPMENKSELFDHSLFMVSEICGKLHDDSSLLD